jgi:hypothetical protein
VLLHTLPGGGKSHLAREYVYRYRKDFPGGVFWVRARSQAQLAAGYWDIARKVLPAEATSTSYEKDQESQDYVKGVTTWFREHHEWLLVLDGIHFDYHEDIRRFIPDSKDTSLIYTSTEKSAGGDHHFMNPSVIKVPLLSAADAQKMLLDDLDKTNPTKDDLQHSMDLVQRMGFLPASIHTVSQRLKATDEPLAKFARSFIAEPKLRGLENLKTVHTELQEGKEQEVLNLTKILAFFSQVIPVEMLTLGKLGILIRSYRC